MLKRCSNILIFLYVFQFNFDLLASQIKTCRLGALAGTQPELICELNSHFIQNQHNLFMHNNYNYVLLLHGSSGNGKSIIACEFARQANAHFDYYSGANIVTGLQGSGAEKIKEIFEIAKKANKMRVIFIDEFDGIASHNMNKTRDDNHLAFQQFNVELDAIKDNKKIFVICATNYIERIPKEIMRRFGSNICEITNPDKDCRKDLITKIISEKKGLIINTTYFKQYCEQF